VLTPQHAVVDQANLAARGPWRGKANGQCEQRGAIENREFGERLGIPQIGVVDRGMRRATDLLAHGLEQDGGLALARDDGRFGGVQCTHERERFPAHRRIEIDVAARHREPVPHAHDRCADDLDVE